MTPEPQPEPPRIHGLRHQTQPTAVTCVQTCLAMALDVPVQDVISVFGLEPMNQEALVCALSRCRVIFNQFTFGTMVSEGWYFAVVPSLNHPGGNHQILIRWSYEDGRTILDPARTNQYAQDGSNLRSWCDLTPFVPGGSLPMLPADGEPVCAPTGAPTSPHL